MTGSIYSASVKLHRSCVHNTFR